MIFDQSKVVINDKNIYNLENKIDWVLNLIHSFIHCVKRFALQGDPTSGSSIHENDDERMKVYDMILNYNLDF